MPTIDLPTILERIAEMWGDETMLDLHVDGCGWIRLAGEDEDFICFSSLADLETLVRDEYAEWQGARRTG